MLPTLECSFTWQSYDYCKNALKMANILVVTVSVNSDAIIIFVILYLSLMIISLNGSKSIWRLQTVTKIMIIAVIDSNDNKQQLCTSMLNWYFKHFIHSKSSFLQRYCNLANIILYIMQSSKLININIICLLNVWHFALLINKIWIIR